MKCCSLSPFDNMQTMDDQEQGLIDDDRVSIGSLFSEESEFHGDVTMKERYEKKVAAYDPSDFWKCQKWNVQRIAADATAAKVHQGIKRKREAAVDPLSKQYDAQISNMAEQGCGSSYDSSSVEAMRPYNPYEGCLTAKQLHESLDDFLTRLSPSITTIATGPWIWIANPSSKHRPLKEDIAGFTQQGTDILESFLSQKSELERQNPQKSAVGITRMLAKDRDQLESDIHSLAKQHQVLCGKWMLFPSPTDIDQIWHIVANSTLHGNLGCSAKVSTVDPEKKMSTHHLVCIYTEDYTDLTDVKRVLREMRRLGLVDDDSGGLNSRPIYYKCDAYTYLDINSGNEFKIRASLYNSKDLFVEMKKEGKFL